MNLQILPKQSILLILPIFLVNCIERFDPQSNGFQSTLVVDGYISSKVEPYTIRLSTSRPLNNDDYFPVINAKVSIVNGEGTSSVLFEKDSGEYVSNPADLVGVIGETYVLDIVTSTGKHYQSKPVKLKSSPPIDSIYYRGDKRLTEDETTLDGIKIMVDAHDPTGASSFYKYEWTETYEIKLPYPAYMTYNYSDPSNPLIPLDIDLKVCYHTVKSNKILITDTEKLIEDRVSAFEVNYVNTNGYQLRSLFSINVKQFTMDEEGYSYWTQLQQSSENQGTLFDPQPYEIRGNITNINDPNEAVLGYFDAFEPSEKRLFIPRTDLRNLAFPSDGCYNQLDSVSLAEIPRHLESGQLIAYPGPYPISFVYMAPLMCTDCRLFGTLTKPDFWPN